MTYYVSPARVRRAQRRLALERSRDRHKVLCRTGRSPRRRTVRVYIRWTVAAARRRPVEAEPGNRKRGRLESRPRDHLRKRTLGPPTAGTSVEEERRTLPSNRCGDPGGE